jgi:hypothetical protein
MTLHVSRWVKTVEGKRKKHISIDSSICKLPILIIPIFYTFTNIHWLHSKLMYNIQCVPSIISLSRAVFSHRKPASARALDDSFYA